ncbi:PTS glucose transporter subunit IIA [Clostridium sp. MCC353]|uniref:PTS sugar transporter subunit IIA n=1 Tax=Clostridium sp. MCC353 TaxID=2592646 RepID=UPI001C01573D|nr:PTS glucose transporter subunit IIA [Clostridium sp. MCC353]MBT9777383.1 PTS glucose transporter subunit IIA [Clostridium sp. MCC353]
MLGFMKKKSRPGHLTAFVSGKVIPMEEVPDPVFSSKRLGDGVAVYPSEGQITAPADGVVSVVMEDSKHVIGLTLSNGMEVLIHVGLDTVALNGEGFTLCVKTGTKVKCGDILLKFDRKMIEERGYSDLVIFVITDLKGMEPPVYMTGMDAAAGQTVIGEWSER